MSRRGQSDPGFGSDSFLDVLANMVGILIILIVIAGVRVARAPLAAYIPLLAEETPAEDEPEEPVAQAAPKEPDPEPDPEIVLEPEPEADSTTPPDDIAAALAALEADLDRLRSQRADHERNLRSAQAALDSAKHEAAQVEDAARADLETVDHHKQRVARLQQSLGERKEALSGLLAEFEEARSAKAPVRKLRHQLTPVSQEIQGAEIHFRLLDNRVSVIPLDQLVERVKSQIEKQKDWLARHNRNQGSVGPVDGYTLRYVVERQQLSALEERKMGFGAFRIGVASWELVPDASIPAETGDQALRRGSRFAVALQSAPENATLTFWVYPDSFGLYRQLQEAAHAEGFLVAARPLPEGVSIAGSPHGTRSAGQ